jgi:hypothetical protein
MSVLNIVELQNVITSATGLTPQAFLSNQLVNVQQMVKYDTKTINVNVISNYDTSPIQIVQPINLSNVALLSNGETFTGGGGTASTVGASISTGLLQIGLSTAGFLYQQVGQSTMFINSAGDATFSGTVTAANFITASDRKWKTDIRPITEFETILSSIHGVRYTWAATGQPDIGVIAQDVIGPLPEAVIAGTEGYHVAYNKLIPVLIEAVKSLQARVAVLERNAV